MAGIMPPPMVSPLWFDRKISMHLIQPEHGSSLITLSNSFRVPIADHLDGVPEVVAGRWVDVTV